MDKEQKYRVIILPSQAAYQFAISPGGNNSETN